MNCKKCKREIQDGALFCAYCGALQTIQERKTKSRGNGTGTVHKLPNGKYMAEVTLSYDTDEDGKRHRYKRTKTFEKKKDAWNALSTLKAKKDEVKFPTLAELNNIFTKSKNFDRLSKSQRDKLGYAWNKLKPLQHEKISELTVDAMQSTIDSAAKTYYPARDMKVILSHLYTLAIQRGKETYNKSEYIELPDSPTAKRQVFSDDEVQIFWNAYSGMDKDGNKTDPVELAGYILIMIYTGMRVGELYKVKKTDVFLNEHYLVGGEKTEAGRDREIPISDKVAAVVKYFYDKGKIKLIERNVWNFYEDYKALLVQLGVRPYPPQTCRHTYFTMLTQNKVHPGLIASMGGHAQYETAIDNYNRLPLQDKIDAANLL